MTTIHTTIFYIIYATVFDIVKMFISKNFYFAVSIVDNNKKLFEKYFKKLLTLTVSCDIILPVTAP